MRATVSCRRMAQSQPRMTAGAKAPAVGQRGVPVRKARGHLIRSLDATHAMCARSVTPFSVPQMLRRQSLNRNADRHRRHHRVQCDLRAQERRFGEDHVVHRDVRRREKSPLPMKRAGSAMRAFRGPHLICHH